MGVGRRVIGPFSDALSDYLGRPVTLAEAPVNLPALDVEPITIVSDESIARLEEQCPSPASAIAGFV